jgi:hypothetical protein
MRIPDIKVSKIEEEGVIQRYRLSQSVLGPYAEGKEEADIVLASPSSPV